VFFPRLAGGGEPQRPPSRARCWRLPDPQFALIPGEQVDQEGLAAHCSLLGGKGTDWGLEQIERARALKQLPSTIVVSLGTNDIWWLHLDLAQGIDDMMAAIGPKREVYWVDLWFGANSYDDLPSPTKANRILRDKAKQYPNLTIVNFAKEFRRAQAADPTVGWDDGVHLNTAGNKVRVRAIARALGTPVEDVEPTPTPEPTPAARP
jgi:hypothetical protein